MQVADVVVEERKITGEELLQIPNVGRCELVEGEIVPMSPTNMEHAFIEMNIGRLLGNFVAERKIGWVLVGEVGVYIQRDPDTVRGADVAFISKQRLPQRPGEGFLKVMPELVVEIVSSNDTWSDLHTKLEEYFEAGVEQVWMVEPKRRAVRVYHSLTEMEIYEGNTAVSGPGPLAEFALPFTEIFPA